jgi:hypothetical protein
MAKSKANAASSISKSRKKAAKAKPPKKAGAAPRLNGKRIRASGDWRAETLAEIRRLIREADPDVVEERKWAKASNPSGVPVWSREGIVCTGETYKQIVKLTFPKGASLKDPQGLFNSSLEGNARRAIDLRKGEALDPNAFKALIQAAVAVNLQSSASKSKSPPKGEAKTRAAKPVKLLSGGNPQIAMADGDAPVQEYIEAMPGWKRDLGKRLDAIIVLSVPNVRKAVKWNSPFYGVEGRGWFLSVHCFTKYVKVTFFNGASLHPIPPGGTPKSEDSRWIDLRENDALDEAQFAAWVKQAAELSGWAI